MRQWIVAAVIAGGLPAPLWAAPPAWSGYAGNAQHTAAAPAAGQPLTRIRWHTPVDEVPQYTDNELFIHYGSPMITVSNLVLVPVKTTATGGFQLEAHAGKTGALIWTVPTDYVLPTTSPWLPSFPAHIDQANRAYIGAAGGTVIYRGNAAGVTGATGRLAFYGLKVFRANTSQMTANVTIDTPITSDANNNLYFGFLVTGDNAANLQSGIARIGANGAGSWISASAAAGDTSITQVAMNCAPAVSADGETIYMAVSNGNAGYLVGLDSATLAPKYKVALKDPQSGDSAWVTDLSSASPTIGPDGDVYYGVLENPFPTHNDRGWLLHFDAKLRTVKTPGSFGWDDTVSVVPTRAIPSYLGTSSYLVMTKYNNYIQYGDGENRIAVLDPDATQQDQYATSPVTVMREVETLLGPTPAPGGGVYEWCINSAVVDAVSGSVFAGSEDGHMYRWDLATNAITQSLPLNAPTAEAYTPSLVGPDGTVYAINNATLYALGK